jgi:hypothetical protein
MITNVGVQIFTFDQTDRALSLLRFLGVFVNDFSSLGLAWVDHAGTRRKASLRKLMQDASRLPNESELPRAPFCLNEGYIPVSKSLIRDELIKIGVEEEMVHLNISPSSRLWAQSLESIASGVPTVRRVLRNVQSVEKAAKFRGEDIMPTALEVTLKCCPSQLEGVADVVFHCVRSFESRLVEVECFGAIDFGDAQLFFPKSGYNPNVSEIYAYDCPGLRSQWQSWRKQHDASFESKGATGISPSLVVHGLSPQ